MIKNIIILADSRKFGGHCIAGKDISTGEWIRPVTKTKEGGIPDNLYGLRGQAWPSIFDVWSIPLSAESPKPYHPEDCLVDESKKWGKIKTIIPNRIILDKLCDNYKHNILWINPSEFKNNDRFPKDMINVAKQNYKKFNSLMLILPDIRDSEYNVLIYKDKDYGESYKEKKIRIRAKFKYKNIRYNLKVTDISLEKKFEAIEALKEYKYLAYLTVSMGEPFEKYDGCHYKLVAAVIETQIPVNTKTNEENINVNDPLYKAIKKWRTNKSKEINLPTYWIFTNKVLSEIVKIKPRTKEELLNVKGIKEEKFKQFGEDILEIVNKI